MSSEENILTTLRLMAWERAKGELQSMLQTYYGEREDFEKVQNSINEFIKKMEDEYVG